MAGGERMHHVIVEGTVVRDQTGRGEGRSAVIRSQLVSIV